MGVRYIWDLWGVGLSSSSPSSSSSSPVSFPFSVSPSIPISTPPLPVSRPPITAFPVSIPLPIYRQPIQVFRRDIPVLPHTVDTSLHMSSVSSIKTNPNLTTLPNEIYQFPHHPNVVPNTGFSYPLHPPVTSSQYQAVSSSSLIPDVVTSNIGVSTHTTIWSPFSPPRNPVSEPLRVPVSVHVPHTPVTSAPPTKVIPPRVPTFVIAPDGSSIPIPRTPDVEDDIHNRTFESDVPPPNPPKWSEYRRMLEYIFAKFPNSRGEEPPPRFVKSEFGKIFPKSDEGTSPLPSLKLFERVRRSLADADERLVKSVEQGKSAKHLTPKRK